MGQDGGQGSRVHLFGSVPIIGRTGPLTYTYVWHCGFPSDLVYEHG